MANNDKDTPKQANIIDVNENIQTDIDVYATDADVVIAKMSEGIDDNDRTRYTLWKKLFADKVAYETKDKFYELPANYRHIGVSAYHYTHISQNDPEDEANHVVSLLGEYRQDITIALDIEGADADDPNIVEKVAKMVKVIHDRTNGYPIIYMNKALTNKQNWVTISLQCPLWGAQYLDDSPTGWQTDPLDSGSDWGAWHTPHLYQYSQHGRIKGYSGDLDLTTNKYAGKISELPWDFSHNDPNDGIAETLLTAIILIFMFDLASKQMARMKKRNAEIKQVEKVFDNLRKGNVPLGKIESVSHFGLRTVGNMAQGKLKSVTKKQFKKGTKAVGGAISSAGKKVANVASESMQNKIQSLRDKVNAERYEAEAFNEDKQLYFAQENETFSKLDVGYDE